jgi:hypothetical protein
VEFLETFARVARPNDRSLVWTGAAAWIRPARLIEALENGRNILCTDISLVDVNGEG